MSFLPVLVMLLVAGLLMYLINNYFPLKGWMKTLLNTIVILTLVFWLLRTFGLIGPL
jgi:hypothetical protein